jgi:hypothetical protein
MKKEKILICGDSYAVTDPMFPNLHWSEKLEKKRANFEICNLAYGGSSNALIYYQLLVGLKLNPTFIVFSFTSCGRYEIDNINDAIPTGYNDHELSAFIKDRFLTNMYNDNLDASILDIIDRYRAYGSSLRFEELKNYFYIINCLLTADKFNIPFGYSLGGFDYTQNYKSIVDNNFVEDLIVNFRNNEIKHNLWQHKRHSSPYFHVKDENAHELFSNLILNIIER